MAEKTYTTDFLLNNTIVEVCKFNKKTGEYVGMKEMSRESFKNMKKQANFRYQEYQKGYSQFNK